MKRRSGETDAEFLSRFAQAAEARADDADSDEWILNRVDGERDEDYAARAAMLGCDPDGLIRLRRRRQD